MPEDRPALFTPGLSDTEIDAESDWEDFLAFREQVDEAIGFIGSVKVKGFDIPNPSAMDPDTSGRYNALQYSLETDLARWPDTKNAEGDVIRLGAPKEPHRRKDGTLEEEYNIRLAKAVLGDRYDAFIAAGGLPIDVQRAWQYFALPAEKRVRRDPKSGDGAAAGEAVPDAD
jgi:hypothetical protein